MCVQLCEPHHVKTGLKIFVKVIDIAGTMEVKFDNNWTDCDIVLNFGTLGPWGFCTFPRCGTFEGRRTASAKIQYNVTIWSIVIKSYLHCPSYVNGLHICHCCAKRWLGWYQPCQASMQKDGLAGLVPAKPFLVWQLQRYLSLFFSWCCSYLGVQGGWLYIGTIKGYDQCISWGNRLHWFS